MSNASKECNKALSETPVAKDTAERCFADLIGQDEAKARLLNLWAEDRVRFILLTGEEGRGKRVLARAFACFCLAMAAEDESAETWFKAGTHPDFTELQPDDKNKLIPVDRVRTAVLADIDMLPQVGRLKVYLINADALGEPSQNALLKTLEEPPAHCLFLLTAARPDRLLPTVLSRATEIRLAPYTDAALKTILELRLNSSPGSRAEGDVLEQTAPYPVTEETLAFAVRFAGGSAGRALAVIQDPDVQEALAAVNDFLFAVPGLRLTDCLTQGEKLFEDYKNRDGLLFDLIEMWLRDRLLAGCVEPVEDDLVYRRRADEFRQAAAGGAPARALLNLAAALQKVREARRYNGNFEIDTTYLLLRIYKELQNA